jgi:acyl-CoA synthetase (NDP forming)
VLQFEDRERLAAVAAVTHVLAPRSVAVIGASRQAGSIGEAVVRNLIANGYHGPLYPVNPAATEIDGIPAFPSVLAIPGEVELAVITVPAAVVASVARECAEKGVRGLVVISAGFGAAGADGIALQGELLDICRQAGMRLVGPNCMGVINRAPEVSLDAPFAGISRFPAASASCRRAAVSGWR